MAGMSKHRAITGFGQSQIASTSTGATWTGPWVRTGPFLPSRCAMQAKFNGSSNGQIVKLQGVLTTNSTAVILVAQRLSSQKGLQVLGTLTTQLVCFVRGNSTKMKVNASGKLSSAPSVTLYFAALA